MPNLIQDPRFRRTQVPIGIPHWMLEQLDNIVAKGLRGEFQRDRPFVSRNELILACLAETLQTKFADFKNEEESVKKQLEEQNKPYVPKPSKYKRTPEQMEELRRKNANAVHSAAKE